MVGSEGLCIVCQHRECDVLNNVKILLLAFVPFFQIGFQGSAVSLNFLYGPLTCMMGCAGQSSKILGILGIFHSSK